MPTIDEATAFLRGIQPGQRVSLWDAVSVSNRGEWSALYVLHGVQRRLPYNPVCTDHDHFRISMRVWENHGFISNMCACELLDGRKRLAVWDMPADAKHHVSATGFDNGKHCEGRRTWQSTMCAVLLETTGGVKLWEQGHSSYITVHSLDRLTCPGCLMRAGKQPSEIDGVTVLGGTG
ncbi:hypothetical protein [Streptomyces sp. NBC_00055]|uniref:hypothetical protein n=1 Tax=Streptomyces sp. NBC_00055 TaxID=2975632 RepID=UPI00324FEEDE